MVKCLKLALTPCPSLLPYWSFPLIRVQALASATHVAIFGMSGREGEAAASAATGIPPGGTSRGFGFGDGRGDSDGGGDGNGGRASGWGRMVQRPELRGQYAGEVSGGGGAWAWVSDGGMLAK